MSKQSVNILWLYEDLLDLYGDHGNITAILYQLRHLGIEYTVEKKSIYDEVDFENCDFVYIGPGKDKNILRACEHISKYKDAIVSAVENKKVFFITGNAQLLFGKEIEDENGNVVSALGLFDYNGKMTGDVFINDFVATPTFSSETKVYGFINRTSYILGDIPSPLFDIKYSGKNIGQTEGILYNNFFSTWGLGPILAKNPELLREVLCRILEASFVEIDDGLQKIALQKTLGEFEI